MKEAMAKNLPMKCEWSQDKNSGASYVKGKNIYVETVVDGKKATWLARITVLGLGATKCLKG